MTTFSGFRQNCPRQNRGGGGFSPVVIVICCCFILISTMMTTMAAALSLLNQVNYTYKTNPPLKLNMGQKEEVGVSVRFNPRILDFTRGVDTFNLTFKITTISPQFDILSLNGATETNITISREKLETSKFKLVHEDLLHLHATYIGRSILKPDSIIYFEPNTNKKLKVLSIDQENLDFNLPITIVQDEGIWGTIFIVSVSVFIIISYINLGAQLDMDNIRKIIKKPITMLVGFLITVIVMPLASWFSSQWFLGDQLIYRVGSFIFACCPAASASTLWAVMLNSDKELSVSLQVASTIGALITMPTLLYLMDIGLNLENNNYKIKVPYARLTQTLFVLLVALFIGWRFVSHNERARKISAKLFRPLTFFVLLFIIVFSSIIYWYIYKMFDWKITLASFVITMTTYLVSGLLGYIINFDIDHAIAISISSTYKNSGIAFAVLLVAFESPDTYIAYVPCLTQVVTTSIMLYLIYCCKYLISCCRGHKNGSATQDQNIEEGGKMNPSRSSSKSSGSGKSAKINGESDEFMAMITTDVLPEKDQIEPSNSGENNFVKTSELQGETTAATIDNN